MAARRQEEEEEEEEPAGEEPLAEFMPAADMVAAQRGSFAPRCDGFDYRRSSVSSGDMRAHHPLIVATLDKTMLL